MSNQFRLIGIRLLDGCAPYIQKNLKINQWYLFDSAYEVVDETPVKKGETFDDFYTNLTDTQGNTSQPSNKLAINIHALVGKNGSGKSALLDIFLRLVNNLACNAFGTIERAENERKGDNLAWVLYMYGELAFSIGDNIYILKQERSKHNDAEKSTSIDYTNKSVTDDNKPSISLLVNGEQSEDSILKNFAYTILLNYSIYAFNTWDYEKEKVTYKPNGKEKLEYWHWLNRLFHKNDGYQSPIVLNPKRKKGNIDINIEKQLSRDRMITLSLLSDERSLYEYGVVRLSINHRSNAYIHKKDKLKQYILDCNLTNEGKDRINARFERLFEICFEIWDKRVGESKINEAWRNDSIGYLAYKTISIAYKYKLSDLTLLDEHSLIMHFLRDNLDWVEDKGYPPVMMDDYKSYLEEFIEYLLTDTSHITNKLHQARYLLKPEVYRFYKKYLNPTHPEEESLRGKRKHKGEVSIEKLKELYLKLCKSKKSKKLYNKEAPLNPLYLVPSPIFDISFTVTKEQEEVPFQGLSSGEKQLIYSISTIMYHIKNVDSVNDSANYKYEHINLVLDEIELYYHPEYQRQFVSRLIKGLRSLRLKRIKSVNVLLATHSPFILSDIPHSKVLYLKEGEPCNAGIEQTLGANIHTLFRNSFFIEGMPIGEFAKEKIKGLSKRLKEGKDLDKLEREIKLIGEPLIRHQLMEQLYQKPYIYEEIERLKNLVKCLEEKTTKQSPKQDEL